MQQESSTITNRMQFKTIHVKLRGVANAFPPPWLRYGSQSICHQWTLLSATASFQVGRNFENWQKHQRNHRWHKKHVSRLRPTGAFSLLSNSLTRHFFFSPFILKFSCFPPWSLVLGQPSPQAFWTRSFLDSTMSCDVTKRYSLALTQASRGQRIKRERLGTRLVPVYYPRTNSAWI